MYLDYLKALTAIPTAPYREVWMLARLGELLGGIPGLEVRTDRWGNVAARLRRGPVGAAHPVAFVAHLDHPGFVVDGPARPDGAVPVLFEGGVADEFFPNGRIRLFRSPDDEGVPARLVEMSPRLTDGDRNRRGLALPEGDASGAVLGMWDLAPLRVEGDLAHSRAIDDLGGVAAILEMLRRLSTDQRAVDVIGLFTRAEEAGFRGTLLLCLDADRAAMLPEGSVAVSVETSSARPTTPIGGGAVLRVGDLSTVFDPAICRRLELVAKEAAARTGGRPLVRALMDGGSCEASAFNQFGYRAAGVCLPLGNYHNMDRNSGRIAEEFISLRDAEDLVTAMAELAVSHSAGGDPVDDLRERYRALAEAARGRMVGGRG